eukprot:702255-Pelagomonas_calceolata.AAC.2
MVTGSLGAVFRTVLETTRTLFVWLVSLGLFYLPLGVGQLGESWTKYSWMQVCDCGHDGALLKSMNTLSR